jgi:hypothetical protein
VDASSRGATLGAFICGLEFRYKEAASDVLFGAVSEAPHSRAVGHLMAKAIEVALTVVCSNRSRAAGYSDKIKKCCFLKKLSFMARTFA